MKRFFLLLTLAIWLGACGSNQEDPNRRANGCILPPKEFSEMDLVGTWYSGMPDWSDTLIIQKDGTYKQILHLEYREKPTLDYESDWQPWRLEYRADGLPYLHLTGMRVCAYVGGNITDCSVVGGGKGKWYDPCKEEWVQMPGEGVLIAMGWLRLNSQTPEPRGVSLNLLLRDPVDMKSYDKLETAIPIVRTATLPP